MHIYIYITVLCILIFYNFNKHRFFLVSLYLLVSLCLKANAEMVLNIPNCHYMLLM